MEGVWQRALCSEQLKDMGLFQSVGVKIYSRQHEGELQTGQSKRSFGNAERYNREEWAQTADQEMQMQLNEADAALVQDGH